MIDIPRLRLKNQHITNAVFVQPAEIVTWLGAVQAQDYAGAKWALGLRLQDAVDDDIDRAFASGSILRTHVMRPTWHFVAPADIRWLLALTAPRVHAVNASLYRKLELDSTILKQSSNVLAHALEGGNQLTRAALRDSLDRAGIAVGTGIAVADGLRLAYIMMYAELEGLVCSGARQGKQFTYALLDERAPQAMALGREEALAELAGRYFTSRGPATVQDFAKWSGLTISDARDGVEAIRGRLHQERVNDRTFWLPATAPPTHIDSPTAHLLSVYDEYVSGYLDRRDIGTEEIGAKLVALGNALYYIIVVNGQIVGTWKRRLSKEAVIIETNYLTALSLAESEAVAQAAQRYGRFLQLPVILSPGQ